MSRYRSEISRGIEYHRAPRLQSIGRRCIIWKIINDYKTFRRVKFNVQLSNKSHIRSFRPNCEIRTNGVKCKTKFGRKLRKGKAIPKQRLLPVTFKNNGKNGKNLKVKISPPIKKQKKTSSKFSLNQKKK